MKNTFFYATIAVLVLVVAWVALNKPSDDTALNSQPSQTTGNIRLQGNRLSLEGSSTPSIDLSGYIDNTDVLAELDCNDGQTVTWNGLKSAWECTSPNEESGGITDTTLSENQVDSFTDNNGYLKIEVDGSTTNELNTDLELDGRLLNLTDPGGTLSLDLSGLNTDKLADLACGEGEVAKVNSGNWTCAEDTAGWPTDASGSNDNPTVIGSFTPWDNTLGEPKAAAWSKVVGGAEFTDGVETRWDSALYTGWNVGSGGGPGVNTEPYFATVMEQDYLNPSGGRWMEWYLEYVSPDSSTQFRPFFIIVDRDNHQVSNIIFQTETGLSFNDYNDDSWGVFNPYRIAINGSPDQSVDTELFLGSDNGQGSQLTISSDATSSSLSISSDAVGQWKYDVNGSTAFRLANQSVAFGDASVFDGAVTSKVSTANKDAHANFTARLTDGQTTSAFQVKANSSTWLQILDPNGRVRARYWDGATAGYSTNPVFTMTGDEDTGLAFTATNTLSIRTAGSERLEIADSQITSSEPIEITDINGIIMRAPDGGRWRVQVDNAGNLTTTSL